MILFFSSNEDGGVLQFAVQLLKECKIAGYECLCMIPKNSVVSVPVDLERYVKYYDKIKTLNLYSKRVGELMHSILKNKPEMIFYVDSSMLSSELCIRIGSACKQYITVHDPTLHPSNDITIRNRIKNRTVNLMRKSACKVADKIVLLSPLSLMKYNDIHKKQIQKTILMNLGAHIPDDKTVMPGEIGGFKGQYFLFFGRIYKYKGISTIAHAFEQFVSDASLVVAGKGSLTDEEADLIESNHRIILINRYIYDSEMLWLFKNAVACVLPYIEASQSGIIPIAYKMGIPVIVSNVDGLTQFVEDNTTGYICSSVEDYCNAMNQCLLHRTFLSDNCIQYYKEELDWQKSLKRILVGVSKRA